MGNRIIYCSVTTSLAPVPLEKQHAIAPASIIDDLTPLLRQLVKVKIDSVKIDDVMKLLMNGIIIEGLENSAIDSVK